SHKGELTKDSPSSKLHYYQVFTIQLEAGKTYRIDHKDAGDDPNFDPFLFLEDADGKVLAHDDDSGGGLNSRIVHKAAKTGVYRLIATTLPAQQTGKYTLEVVPADADEEKEAALRGRLDDLETAAPAAQ